MRKVTWVRRFIARIVKHGFSREEAWKLFGRGEVDFDYEEDPIICADDEVSYWREG